MPAATESESSFLQKVIGIILLSALAGLLVVSMILLWRCPTSILCLLVFALILIPAYIFTARRSRTAFDKLMAPRASENICSFRGAFDLRQVDPWIVRAVHEEVLGAINCGLGKTKYAIRASDRLVEDLLIDDEELGDIAETIAQRAGYDFTDTTTNPLYGKVMTVGDLVIFFTHQRRIRS